MAAFLLLLLYKRNGEVQKRAFQRGTRMIFKTYCEIAKVGSSCCPEIDLLLNSRIGLERGNSQLSNTLCWMLSETVYQQSYLVPAKKINKLPPSRATSYKAVNFHYPRRKSLSYKRPGKPI